MQIKIRCLTQRKIHIKKTHKDTIICSFNKYDGVLMSKILGKVLTLK